MSAPACKESGTDTPLARNKTSTPSNQSSSYACLLEDIGASNPAIPPTESPYIFISPRPLITIKLGPGFLLSRERRQSEIACLPQESPYIDRDLPTRASKSIQLAQEIVGDAGPEQGANERLLYMSCPLCRLVFALWFNVIVVWRFCWVL